MLWYSVECSINSSIYNSIYNNLLTLLCGSLSYLLIFYVNVECAYAKQDIALKMSFTDVFIPGYMQINSVDKIVWLLFQMNYKLQNHKPQNIFVFHTWCKAFQIFQHILRLPEVVKSVLNTIFCIQICVICDIPTLMCQNAFLYAKLLSRLWQAFLCHFCAYLDKCINTRNSSLWFEGVFIHL